MNQSVRLSFALEHALKKSVAIFSFDDWGRLIREDGTPTILPAAPAPLLGVQHQASVVTITASGILNSTPGIDVVRLDPRDAPYIYNIDHYTVIERLDTHPQFKRVLDVAEIAQSSELERFLHSNVFFVGPYNTQEEFALHWCKTIPPHILGAKWKGGQ